MILRTLSWSVILLTLLFSACKSSRSEPMAPAGQLLARTLAAHGGDRYETAHFAFRFRDRAFSFRNEGGGFLYTSVRNMDGEIIQDALRNGSFVRTINGVEQELTEKQVGSYSAALNSVIYFATLPHKLTDPAVNLTHLGEQRIRGKDYEVLGVTFDEKGGGTDHDDEFHYWINREGTIDYLAYNYKVNGGGVRFRAAYNPRRVGGVLFQDYVNYKAPVGTALMDLPGLYEAEALVELSRIETEEIRVLGE